MDGVFRIKWNTGISCYGTIIFSKSYSNGEEEKKWRLFKYANGNIIYQEKVFKIGQDKDWRVVTEYKFDDTSLEWIKEE